MQSNILDIRHSKNLYWIIDNQRTNVDMEKVYNSKIAIFAHLFYENTLDQYTERLAHVDTHIDIYIISSSEDILSKCKKKLGERKNSYYILKENRGRDVSALLVAARPYVLKYDFFCFLHDKRVKKSEETGDTELWIKSIQDNLISSNEYVLNVIDTFLTHTQVGVLVPPEPIGEHIYAYYHNSWDHDFEPMLELQKEFNLECNLNPRKAPITIGTILWARTASLKKMFEKKWEYIDFPGEPFPDDGSISHAIERSFGFFAQDAGYFTGTIMTAEYATILINQSQSYMRETFEYLEVTEGIKNIRMVRDWRSLINEDSDIMRNRHNLYIYGAGRVAKRILLDLFRKGIVPKKILVSTQNDIDNLLGVPVEVCTVPQYYADGLIIIGVGEKLKPEIVEYLNSLGLKNYIDYQ